MELNVLTAEQIDQIALRAAEKAAAMVYDGDRYMRPATVAKYCDVSPKTVLRWKMPTVEIGGVRLYRKSDVDRFLSEYKIKRHQR